MQQHIIMGIDPGLAHTGWGIIEREGSRITCLAYGCIATLPSQSLPERLNKIFEQVGAVIDRFHPESLGIETVWFGENVTAAFGTGQARGAALVACARGGLTIGEYTPTQIKAAVVGNGSADKAQIGYMVAQILDLSVIPRPDHAADALAAAICYTTHQGGLTEGNIA